MFQSHDESQAPVTLTAQRNPSGGVELIRTCARGRTIYFDSPEDAIRRWKAWGLASPYSLYDPAGLLIELWIRTAIDTARQSPSDTPVRDEPVVNMASAPVFDRVVCLADTFRNSNSRGAKRAKARHRPESVFWLLGARILYGDRVPVLRLSTNGIMIETSTELPRGMVIPIELFGRKGVLHLAGQVIRTRRFVQGDVVWYESTCRFRRSVDLWSRVPRFLTRGSRNGEPGAPSSNELVERIESQPCTN